MRRDELSVGHGNLLESHAKSVGSGDQRSRFAP
jgi:hypothetical protein